MPVSRKRALECEFKRPSWGFFLYGRTMQSLTINGMEKTFPEGLPETLSHLLKQLNICAETVVAEVDGAIVKREDFSSLVLAEGQDIELVRFVGGG